MGLAEQILGPDPKVYLEIGVYDGGSLASMMQHPHETELHGVDPLVLPGQVEHTFANIAVFNTFDCKVTVHRQYSHDTVIWRELDGISIDIIFIDGDHHASSVGTLSGARPDSSLAASFCSTTTSILSARQACAPRSI